MLDRLNKKFWNWFAAWNARLKKMEIETALQRDGHRLLVFFHGYSLAHTIRPLVVARTLRQLQPSLLIRLSRPTTVLLLRWKL